MARITNTKELIQELRLRMEEGNVTMIEVIENLPDVNPLLIEMIFNNTNNEFAEGLDAILSFAKLRLNVATNASFSPYYITPSNKETALAVYRSIKPKCSIRFNYATGEFYDFRCDKDVSRGRQKIFKAEMRLIAEDFLRRKKKNVTNIL